MFNNLAKGIREVGKLFRLRRELDHTRNQLAWAQSTTEGLLVDLALLNNQDRSTLKTRNTSIRLITDHPVAESSADHVAPRGTAVDMTRSPAFVGYCERIFGERVSYLDLGCSGGGVVLDFVLRGSLAIGLEGSDFSKRVLRGAWRIIPSNLFTCNICAPFSLVRGSESCVFDVIGAWEVLEHIPEELIPGLLRNIANHMGPRSVFMASVATFPDEDKELGVVWHVTVKPRDWWMKKFFDCGFESAELVFDPLDMPRGGGLIPHDWSALRNPELGFHVVLRKRGSGPLALAQARS